MFKNTLKIELKKAFSSKAFFMAVTVGICIAVVQAIATFHYVSWVLEGQNTHIHPNGFDGISLIQLWLGGEDFVSPYGMIFYLILPLLSAWPYGSSYFQEKKNGYASQMITRSGKQNYLGAKWVASFLIGAVVIAIPLLLNLMLDALICPLGRVNVLSLTTGVMQRWFLYQLFYTHPILYMLSGILLGAMWGGVCSVIALAFGTIIKNKIVIRLSAFLLLEVLSVGWLYIHRMFPITDYELQPMHMMRTVALNPNPEWIIIPYLMILTGIAAVIYWKRGMRSEAI